LDGTKGWLVMHNMALFLSLSYHVWFFLAYRTSLLYTHPFKSLFVTKSLSRCLVRFCFFTISSYCLEHVSRFVTECFPYDGHKTMWHTLKNEDHKRLAGTHVCGVLLRYEPKTSGSATSGTHWQLIHKDGKNERATTLQTDKHGQVWRSAPPTGKSLRG
jgi:hypothetical protein